MMELQKLVEQTNKVFENNDELVLPKPPEEMYRKLEAYKSAGLKRQGEFLTREIRQWQSREIGLIQFEADDFVRMLMKEDFSKKMRTGRTSDNKFHRFIEADSYSGETCGRSDGRYIQRWVRKNGFFSSTKWEVSHGLLEYLDPEIPYGVVLKISELKKLHLFNIFSVFAPSEAFSISAYVDPIVVGEIWTPDNPDSWSKLDYVDLFFIAQW